jgi:hypothetical protein
MHRRLAFLAYLAMLMGQSAARAGAQPAAPDMTMPDMAMPTAPAGTSATPMAMTGAFGPYGMAREASGTSWQPDSTPDGGLHAMLGAWALMVHGMADAVFDDQGGRRGADKIFSPSMLMLMAQHQVGAAGTLGLRAMVSLDPLMGANGYPLLFATGETADGRTPLVDRQHPHDLFMELSASYSLRLMPGSSVFLYGGLPGEPALGPPAFMHRASGMDIPEAPITHHWLDSTHITYGVLTAGYVRGDWKIEGSVFRGREPDQERYDIEAPRLDSASVRLSWNPAPDWSLQASFGHLRSPEQLAPDTDEDRATASATWNRPLGAGANLATTFAWGRKMEQPGPSLDGFLLESELTFGGLNTVFARAERVAENELFDDAAASPLLGRVFTVDQLTLGYIRDVAVAPHVKLGLGGLVTRYAYPAVLDSAYGGDPTSFLLFLRARLE